jgi:hypothetical protein
VNGAQFEADLTAAEVKVSGFARAVAMRRATILAFSGLVLAFAVSRGWVTPALSAQANSYIADGLGFAATIGAGAWIHRAVTPAKQSLQPVNSDGQKLVPDPSASDALTDYTTGDATVGAAFDDALAGTMAPDPAGSSGAHAQSDTPPGDPAALGATDTNGGTQ